jgi:AraC family transcriptional regulator
LAEESGYSRAHFLRMFRTATGITPHQYVLDVRIRHAQESLKRKGTNLIDVAALCGFSSQSHMTSVFRKRLGVTPAEFRRGQ